MNPQALQALTLANEVRLSRCAVRRAIKAQETTIAQALEEPCCQSMTVSKLLSAQPKWGQIKTMKALSQLQIGPNRKLEDLTDRQRAMLLAALTPERTQDPE